MRCYLALVVPPPGEGSTVSHLDVRAWLSRRWHPGRTWSSHGDPYVPRPGDPDAPTAQSAAILAKARKPIDLDVSDAEGLIYDHREDSFIDGDGNTVTPVQILNRFYTTHCRTLRLGFRIRWAIGSGVRHAIRVAVWKGQDAVMWALLNFYDVEVVGDKKKKRVDFFYKYKPSDFRRITDKPGERSHFFGFQTSQKSLFTNLTLVVAACLLIYWKVPRYRLLLAVYKNVALTTTALVFGFLVADTVVPWLFIKAICVLSRFRDAVLFMIRKVKVKI